MTASIQPPAAAPAAPPKASPPPAPTATAPLPATTATTPQPATTASTPQQPEVLNDIKAAENDSTRSKRTKRAERAKDRQNRAARVRSIPQNDYRDASGATVRTYETEGGGRVTVYQRGPTLQVGDRVDFGDSARSRRRVATERAERRYGSRDDDASSRASETRGFGEFFFGR